MKAARAQERSCRGSCQAAGTAEEVSGRRAFPGGRAEKRVHEGGSRGEELCYVKEGLYFQLPDRKLTDEELLEVIDFTYKRDCAVTEQAKETLAGLDSQREEMDV